MGQPVSGATVGQVYDLAVSEFNSASPSVPIQPIGPVVFASDNPAVVAVSVDAAGNQIATAISAGSANVSALDQGNNLTDTVNFTVSAAPPPVADTLVLTATLASAKRRVKK